MPEQQSYAGKAAYSIGLLLICLLLANAAGYLQRLLLATSLSPAEFGLIYAVFAFFGLISFAHTLGLTDALAQKLPRVTDEGKIKTAFLTSLYTQLAVMAVIFTLVAYFAQWLAGNYFHEQAAAALLIIYGLAMFLSPTELALISLFQGIGRATWYGYMSLIRAVFLLISTATLLKLGLGMFAPVYSYVLVYMLVPLIYLPVVMKFLPKFSSAKAKFDTKLLGEMLRFGIPVVIASTVGIFLTHIDTFFLTLLRSLEEVALYNIALPTASLFWFIGSAIYTVMLPMSSDMQAKNGLTNLQQGAGTMYLYLLIFLLPVTAAMVLFPELIINALFGAKYIAAAPALQLLAVGGIFFTLNNLSTSIIVGLGESKAPMKAMIAAAIVNVILDIALIPRFGITGSAAATLIAFIVLFGVNLSTVKKLISFTFFSMRLARLCVATALFSAALIYLRSAVTFPLWWKIIGIALVGSVIYGTLLFALRVLTFKEIKDLLYRAIKT